MFFMRALALLVLLAPPAIAQDYLRAVDTPKTELLWPGGAPGAVGAEDLDKPAITFYQPAKSQATGTIVVICPGGGYGALAMDHEGHQVARWLTAHGVAAAIVKYRLGPRYRHPAPLQDVLRAIRVVRSRATELGVKPDRIGVMGFSAGGHLASSAATLFDLADAKVADDIEAVSSRPDFAILGYPVIVFGADVTHKGSQRNLLGETPSADMVTRLSTDRQVSVRQRPFTTVQELRRDAEKQYREKEDDLTKKLSSLQQELTKLQASGEGGKAALTETERLAVDKFKSDMLTTRRDLRSVKLALRQDIDRLDAWLKFANIAAVPLSLGLGGIGLSLWRSRRKSSG